LGLAVRRRVQTRHDLQDRGLSGAVRAYHADLRAGQERHGDVVEDELVTHGLAGSHHGIDVLGHEAGLLLSAGIRNGSGEPTIQPTRLHYASRPGPHTAGTMRITSRCRVWRRPGSGPARAAARRSSPGLPSTGPPAPPGTPLRPRRRR